MSPHRSASSAVFDVSEHIPPIRGETVFGNSKPLTLDIGCGNGEFLLELSHLMPGFNHIGVEIKTGRFRKAVKKTEKSRAENLKFIHLDACFAVACFARESLYRVYINFPDPWPKDRHLKHRIINGDFVSLLASALAPGGFVEITSDHEGYIGFAGEVFSRSGRFQSAEFLPCPAGRPETRFEKIFRQRGDKIKYLVCKTSLESAAVY